MSRSPRRKYSPPTATFPSRYAHLLREVPFECHVPDLATMNPSYIETVGVTSTGDRELDQRESGRYARVALTIFRIIEYYENNIPIVFPNREHMLLMHEYITGYLNEWREHISESINTRVTDYSDLLRSLDDFNKWLYQVLYHKELVEREKTNRQRIGLVSSASLMRKEREVTPTSYEERYGGIRELVRERINYER